MKIVHITKGVFIGKASGLVWSLHKGLQHEGVQSKIILIRTNMHDETIIQANQINVFQRKISRFFKARNAVYFYNKEEPNVGSFTGDQSFYDIERIPDVIEADIIHLHWVAGFINVCSFFRHLSSFRKKFVWTLHDLNPLSGGCHQAFDCHEFTRECRGCPYLKATHLQDELAHAVWNNKKKAYAHMNSASLHFISPSRWMEGNAKDSSLGARFPVHVIPHGIDTRVFQRHDRNQARSKFNVPEDVFVVLFVSEHVRNKNKGLEILVDAIARLGAGICLVTCGHPGDYVESRIPHIHLGFIDDKGLMAQIYSMADCTAVLSRTESFGLTALESIACGTPVIATRAGGLTDTVGHYKTGLLLSQRDAKVVAEMIQEMATLVSKRFFNHDFLSEHVRSSYSMDKNILNHIDIYNELYHG